MRLARRTGSAAAAVLGDARSLWCAVVGAGEIATGLGLLAAPTFVLGVLGLGSGSLEPVAVGFVGAFVLGVGGILWLPLRLPRGLRREERLAGALEGTALVRLVVAVFVIGAVQTDRLSGGWLLVGGYDLAVALAQGALLAIPRAGEGPG